ncbi:MAG: glycosyltransferase family 4 protein [Planctomycetes bacterium]|nr:glycosyltransferase family 4 protein [Planctomycetota bacterium]
MSDVKARRDGGVRRVAFVSTRIAGTDGVTLEIGKWTEVLERMGIQSFFITGESDRPADRTFLIEEAHFNHPEILNISRRAFDVERRTPELTDDIFRMMGLLREKVRRAIDALGVDALVAENALTIPMNLPLGMALVLEIQERGIAALAHHHDFYWERERFLVGAVDDFLRYAFPPALPQIQHVVINSLAGEEFSRRTGLSCRIIPNVMDFANPPPPPDDYARLFRSEIGLRDDELLILQPTRVVARKGIELAIELVRRLTPLRAALVITHASGDEGDAYAKRIREFAEMLNVNVIFAHKWIADQRGTAPDGHRLFTIHDVYPQADIVAYPSTYEGFGNAFLEAVYHKRPIVCNRYAIYRTDIEPVGMRPILFDGFPTHETVDQILKVLGDARYRQQMVDENYEVARRFFSYEILENELRLIVQRPHNIYRFLGRARRAVR